MANFIAIFVCCIAFQYQLVEASGTDLKTPAEEVVFASTTEENPVNDTRDTFGDLKDPNFFTEEDHLTNPSAGSFINVPVFKPKFTHKKCHCDIQQIWDGNQCHSTDTETIFNLFQQIQPFSENQYENMMFSSVDIDNDVGCSSPNQLATIENDFIIADNGDLIHEETGLNFSITEYCYEVYSDQQYETIKATVCLSPPAMPYCCDNGQCHDVALLDPIAVSFMENNFFWNRYDLLQGKRPICDQNSQENHLILKENKDNLFFHFGYEDIEMLYAPSDSTSGHEIYSIDNYCLENDAADSLTVRFCYKSPIIQHEKECRDSVCISKCCPLTEVFVENVGCLAPANENDLFSPAFHVGNNQTSASMPENLHIVPDFPRCDPSGSYILDPLINPADKFHLMENGSLYIQLSNLSMPASKYCTDNFEDSNGLVSNKAIVCFLQSLEVVDHCKEVHKILYPILIVISCLFLVITLIVYASLPELRAKLHGKCLLSHVSSLMVAFFCQLVISWNSKNLSMIGCKIIALGNQVSFLWAFFWLNVMCFDIWWTLKSMSPSPVSGESSRKRFIYYSIYAWGCPLIIASITGFLEFLPKSLDKTGLILPGFGVRSCWFQDTLSTWIYFHGFTLFLYVLNILFFFHVAAILIKGQKATEGILRKTKQQHKERMYLYLKLFIVMGITWICEVASWQEGTCPYWIFTDIINSLQGVFIFFIFMCNRKVYQKMHARGVPFFTRIKSLARAPSSMTSGSRRTTQTSVESSSRRLSSSLQPSLSNLTRKSS